MILFYSGISKSFQAMKSDIFGVFFLLIMLGIIIYFTVKGDKHGKDKI